MGFMDKVKSQAATLAEKAQEGARVGQERLSQLQAKRQSDALLLELGGLVYLERAGRPDPGGEARATEIVAKLQAFEAEHGQVSVTLADPPVPPPGTFVPGGAGGAPAEPGAASPPPPAPATSPPTTSPPTAGGVPTGSYSSDEEPGES